MSDDAKVNFDLPTGIQNLDLTLKLTSPPYPIIVFEAMTTQAGVGGLFSWEAFQDGLGTTASVDSLRLRPVLLQQSQEPEALGVTVALDTIALNLVLKETTVEPEALDVSASLDTILLEEVVVQTTLPDEAIDVTVSLDTIELS